MKGDKQIIVDEIAKLIKDCNKKADILTNICNKFQFTQRTFETYWKKAQEAVKELQQSKNEALNEQTTQTALDLAKEGLKSDLELEIILCQFATNGVEVEEWVKGNPIIRGITPNESINAIREIYKKRGSYAPAKVAQTTTDGKDIDLKKLSATDMLTILAIQEKLNE